MSIESFVEKEKYNNAYADGFKAGLEHAQRTIHNIETRLYLELVRSGQRHIPSRATPILRQIIKEMWE